MNLLLAIILWLVTFPVAWWLLPKIMLDKPSDYRYKLVSWVGLRLLYILVIVLPYLPLLTYSQLGSKLKIGLYSLFVVMLLSTFVRVFYKRRFVSALWSIYSLVYDGLLKFYPYNELLEQMTDMVLRPSEPLRVMDIGAGTGNLSRSLLDKSKNIEFLACVDSSTAMLEVANRKIDDKRLQIIHSDTSEYLKRTPDHSFNAIAAMNFLYTQYEKDEILSNIKRILSPGGKLVLTDPIRGGNYSLIKHHMKNDKWYKLLNPKLIIIWIVDNFLSQLSKNGEFSFNSQDELLRLLTKNKFTIEGEAMITYGGANVILVAKVE